MATGAAGAFEAGVALSFATSVGEPAVSGVAGRDTWSVAATSAPEFGMAGDAGSGITVGAVATSA